MNIIEQLKAAHAAATPGAWDYTIQANNLSSVYGNCQENSMADADLVAFDIRREDDAELIALMHNNLPALLEAVEVLEAIQARINGEFDNPALERMGPLSADMREDIRQWCDAALAKLKGEA